MKDALEMAIFRDLEDDDDIEYYKTDTNIGERTRKLIKLPLFTVVKSSIKAWHYILSDVPCMEHSIFKIKRLGKRKE